LPTTTVSITYIFPPTYSLPTAPAIYHQLPHSLHRDSLLPTKTLDILLVGRLPVYGSSEAKTAKFSGRRLKRGLYKSLIGVKFNADVNGSYNIIRKVVPDAFCNGIEGVVVHPVKITLTN
jgi:hypothetical protein